MLKLSANTYWKFYRGIPPRGRVINSNNPHDHGLEPCDVRYDDSEWETVHLPHTVREEKLNCSGGYNYLGECWYRKQFTVDKDWENKVKFFENCCKGIRSPHRREDNKWIYLCCFSN